MFIFYLTLKQRNKKPLHYAFLFNIIFIFMWIVGINLDFIFKAYHHGYKVFINIAFTGVALLPVSFFYTAFFFAFPNLKFRFYYILVIPLTTLIILWNEKFHYLFFVKYSFYSYDIIYGSYFKVHAVFSYTIILIGLILLSYSSIKNFGFYSKQSLFIMLATLIPLVGNIIFTFDLSTVNQFIIPILFSISLLLFWYAIFKLEFLKILPIAQGIILNNISDSVGVLDNNLKIIDYNQQFYKVFEWKIKRGDCFIESLKNAGGNIYESELASQVDKALKCKTNYQFESQVDTHFGNRTYMIEIRSILYKSISLGLVLVFKDITELKEKVSIIEQTNKNLSDTIRALEETKEQLVQSEKMASLGSLVAGIAHEINTPLGIAITSCTFIEDLAKQTLQLFNENQLRKNDLNNFFKNIDESFSIINKSLKKSADLVRSFKQIAVDQNYEELRTINIQTFLEEFVVSVASKIDRANHKILISCTVNEEVAIYTGALTMILNNLVSNSLEHAFAVKENGTMLIEVIKMGQVLRLRFADDGCGIESDIIGKVFDPFFTTSRGSNGGMGLGLYIVYNLVTSKLHGQIMCLSENNNGTVFTILIPFKN